MLARNVGMVSVVIALTIANAFTADKPGDGASPGAKALGDKQGRPLKVFIMSGQSNMQGMANVATLRGMASDPVSKDLYNKLMNADGTPKVFEDVRVAAFSSGTKVGPLSTGFGGGLPEDNPSIGIEFAFGAILYEHLQEPFLIIKASWGGKSLNADFRSPSSGPYYEFPEKVQDRTGNRGNLITAKEQIDKAVEKTGVYYRLLIEHVKTVLADPQKYHPKYDPKTGFELAGFIWLQGWNDLVDHSTYPGKGDDQYAEYTRLMASFIRDVRKDLAAPKMPFVIDVLGVGGATDGPFQKAQAAAADMPEFKGNVAAVLMGKYWDHKLGELLARPEAIGEKGSKKNPGEEKYADLREKLTPLQQEYEKLSNTKGSPKAERLALKARITDLMYTKEEQEYISMNRSNQGFHYLGSAKIYSRVGEATAEAIVNMKGNGN